MLTQARLKELLHYSPETGVFTRRVATCSRVKVGDTAGSTDTHGYRQIGVLGEHHLAHRLVWLYVHGTWPRGDLDHRDRVRSNNKLGNLREASRVENNSNVSLRKDNLTGFKGVSWSKLNNRWIAQCQVTKRKYHLGLFDTPEEASVAYQAFAKEYHGEFYHQPQEL